MDFRKERAALLRDISRSVHDTVVLAAMDRVPREKFVPVSLHYAAYEDHPLPIGHEQTISQPTIIAMMTEALELTPQDAVLEIGTGSGYQTAVLAELCGKVVSVERIPELLAGAEKTLQELGYRNIELHPAMETLGWPPDAPYDAILVTAGAPHVPGELIEQLKEGGRLVIPVGKRYTQELCKFTRRGGETILDRLGGCRFVSLIGKNAWEN